MAGKISLFIFEEKMMSEIIRPLSALERWYWICDQFSTLNVISRVRIHGLVHIGDLRHALDKLQAQHPLLQMKIEHDKNHHPRWISTKNPIPLRVVQKEKNEQWLDEINDQELLERINPDVGPLMRTVVMIGLDGVHEIILVISHIIADGTTALNLAKQWLILAVKSEIIECKKKVVAPIENLIPTKFSNDECRKRLNEQNIRDRKLIEKYRPGRVMPTTQIPFELRQSQLIHQELNSYELTAVVQLSRKNKTTVHGAVTAALALASAQDASVDSDFFAIGSPIDLRRELIPPVSPDEVGSYVATVLSVVDLSKSFWEIAREISDDLYDRKQSGHHFNLITTIAEHSPQSVDVARPFIEFMESEGPINLVSSNLGRFPFQNKIGAWDISDAQFLSGISVNGYFVATINSSNNRLFWNFTYIKHAIPRKRAEDLSENCLRILREAITT